MRPVRRWQRRQPPVSTLPPEAKPAPTSDTHIPAVSVQRQAARALITSADLVDAHAAALALAAKQRNEWVAKAAHARGLSRLQTAVELATQLHVAWVTQRRDVRKPVRRKVDAQMAQLSGEKEIKSRQALKSPRRVDRQALRVTKALDDAVDSAADAMNHSRRPAAAKKKERRREGGSQDAKESREGPSKPKTAKLPPLVQMTLPHQFIPAVLWRMYEGVMAHPRTSYKLRRAMQDVVESIRERNPYFFLKTIYRPPPVSASSNGGDGRWEVRRTNAVNAIISPLLPLLHDLSLRAYYLSSPDADARKQAWFDSCATLHVVRRLALHFHFVVLHLYAVTMGRHDRTATPWTFEQLVYSAQCDELTFRRSLRLADEAAHAKDFLITDTFQHAPELLVFMDAWRDEKELSTIGEPVTDEFGFTAREHFQAYVPVFKDGATFDAVRELGLELKRLCDDWARSPLGSGALTAIRIEALGVVEKTIKHRLRGVMEITHKITLARWMERRERFARAKWWRKLNVRGPKQPRTFKNKTLKAGGGSSLADPAAERPGCSGEANGDVAAVHCEQQPTKDESSSLPSCADDPEPSDRAGKEGVDVSVSPVLAATPSAPPRPSKSDDVPVPTSETTTTSQATGMVSSSSSPTVVDYRNRVKKVPDDPQQTGARDGFRAPVSVKYASWLASSSRPRSSMVQDGLTTTNQSSGPVTTRLRPEQAAGAVVKLKDVYTWTDDEIDAHEREMERICNVRNELLGLRDALTVVKLEHDASELLGSRPAQRQRATSAESLRGLTLAAVSVEARALSETVAAFGEEVAMHGAAEALIKRPSLRVAAVCDNNEASTKRFQATSERLEEEEEVDQCSLDVPELMQALQSHLATLEGSDGGGDGESVDADEAPISSLARMGVANLALLRMVNEQLVDAAASSAERA